MRPRRGAKPTRNTRTRGHALRRISRRAGALLLATGIALPIVLSVAIQPAAAAVSFSVVPNFPSPVLVGQTGLAGSITISNRSTGSDSTNDQVTSITLVPSCGDATAQPDCPVTSRDPGVFQLSATATGRSGSGSACSGVLFDVRPIGLAGDGKVQFVPVIGSAAIILGNTDSPFRFCTIDFTLEVLKMPTVAAGSSSSGIVTAQLGAASGSNTQTGVSGSGVGSSLTEVDKGVATLTTSATPTAAIGNPISDLATLASPGSPNAIPPIGSITYDLSPASCEASPVASFTTPVNGFGSYPSGTFTATDPAQLGQYYWQASYSGDNNYNAVFGPNNCARISSEISTITQATVAITTTASAPVQVEQTVFDTATLTGGFNAGGSITFSMYGPNDATCAGLPSTSTPVPVTGQGTYTSQPFTAVFAGKYQFVASYSGDPSNFPVVTGCGAANESVVAAPAVTLITTTASPTVAIGGAISDSAAISGTSGPGGSSIGGTITFNVFGPNDATCSGSPVVTSMSPGTLPGGTYASGPFFPTLAGTYRYVVDYSGSSQNAPSTSPCNAANETSVVSQAVPTLTTAVSAAAIPIGGSVNDVATVARGFGVLQGTIDFTAYGPNDATCSAAPTFTSSGNGVDGPGTYPSADFTPATAGTYHFVAAYSGDANNAPVTTACNDANETVVVSQAAPTLVTQASAAVPGGGTISDTATLTGGVNPTGTITFSLYGPNDSICDSTPTFTSTRAVTGNGPYASGPFTPANAGSYIFVAIYSGDANNASVTTACADPAETLAVTLNITVTKVANPATLPEPGGNFTFRVTTANPSDAPVTITGITDDVYGNVGALPGCSFLIGTTVAPGATSPPCVFVGTFTGVAGQSQTDTATVTVSSATSGTGSGQGSATVTLTPKPPPTTTTTSTTVPTTTTTSTTTTTLPTTSTTSTTVPATTSTSTTATPPSTTVVTAPPVSSSVVTTPPTTPPPTTRPTTTSPPTTRPPTTRAPVPIVTTLPATTVAPTTTPPTTATTTLPTTTSTTTSPLPPTTLPTTPPALQVQSLADKPSGPAGVGLKVAGANYPSSCKTAYFFFDGVRIGSASVRNGFAQASGLSSPGDAGSGVHTVSTSCHASGGPVVNRARFVVTKANAHRSSLVTSTPLPRQVNFTLHSLLLSAVITVLLLLLLGFPSQLFNSTLTENYEEVRGWFGLRRPLSEIVQDVNQRILFPLFLLAGGALYALLTPEFGFNLATLALVVGLAIAVAVTTIGFAIPTFAFFGRRYRDRGQILVMPGSIIIGAIFVLLSRLLHFQPGYLYGLLAVFVFHHEIDRETGGRLAAVSSLLVLALAIGAWFAQVPVAGFTMGNHASFWGVVLEAALCGAFIIGLESTLVGLLPLRFLDGNRIRQWSRSAWGLLFAFALFALIEVLFQPGSGYVGHTTRTGKITVGALYVVFALISVAFWAYFRFRPARLAEGLEEEGEYGVR